MHSKTRPWFLCLALLLSVESAWALRVLVVRPAPGDAALFEAFGRLKAELELQGFEVAELDGALGVDASVLEAQAAARDAFAAVALQRKAGSAVAEVHVVDRVTGKTVTRKLEIAAGRDGPMLLAIRAADLLRLSLLELEPGESAPADVVGAERAPPPSEIARFARDPLPFQLAAGGGMFWHPGFGAAFGPSLSARFRPLTRLSLGIEFSGPAFGAEYESAQGAAKIRQELAVFSIAWNLAAVPPGPRVEVGPLLALGALHLDARGDVEPPLVGQSQDLWSAALVAGVHVELYPSDSLSVGFELAALGLLPRPVIAVADQHSEALAVQVLSSLRFGVSF